MASSMAKTAEHWLSVCVNKLAHFEGNCVMQLLTNLQQLCLKTVCTCLDCFYTASRTPAHVCCCLGHAALLSLAARQHQYQPLHSCWVMLMYRKVTKSSHAASTTGGAKTVTNVWVLVHLQLLHCLA